MKLAGFSTEGPRLVNEDAYFVLDFSGMRSFSHNVAAFLMVSDGMGGHESGDVASRIAVQAAKHYLNRLLTMAQAHHIALDVPLALEEITRNANEAIISEMQSRGNSGMGATFVGAFVSPRKAWIAHVGDSRAYLLRRGKAIQLTKDHSAVGRLLGEGLITEKEAQNHPERNVIERALGFTNENPEIIEVHLAQDDGLLLCSDGVSTVLSSHLMAESVMCADSVESAAKNVIVRALQKHTDDNATVVIAVSNWDSFKAHAPEHRRFSKPQKKVTTRQPRHRRSTSNRRRRLTNQHDATNSAPEKRRVNLFIAILVLAATIVAVLMTGLWLSASGDNEIPGAYFTQQEVRAEGVGNEEF